jgi:hypothetical protein
VRKGLRPSSIATTDASDIGSKRAPLGGRWRYAVGVPVVNADAQHFEPPPEVLKK